MKLAGLALIAALAGAGLGYLVHHPAPAGVASIPPTPASSSSPASGRARPTGPAQLAAASIRASGPARAWIDLEESDGLTAAERLEARHRILAEWYRENPEAALRTALEIMEIEAFFTGESMLEAFDQVILENPETFLDLLDGERFGLSTGLARHHWIRLLGRTEPGILLTFIDRLRGKAAGLAAEMILSPDHRNHPDRTAWIDSLASLPETPGNQRIFERLGAEYADRPFTDLVEGARTAEGGLRTILRSAIVSRVAGARDPGQAIEQLALVPRSMQSEVLDAAVKQIDDNPVAYTAVIDAIIERGDWDRYHRELPHRLHNMLQHTRDPVAIADWATTIPPERRFEDLYRVGIRSYVSTNPDTALTWIKEIRPGWHRDNSLVEYASRALYLRNDPEAARAAREMIADPHFREESEGHLRHWLEP